MPARSTSMRPGRVDEPGDAGVGAWRRARGVKSASGTTADRDRRPGNRRLAAGHEDWQCDVPPGSTSAGRRAAKPPPAIACGSRKRHRRRHAPFGAARHAGSDTYGFRFPRLGALTSGRQHTPVCASGSTTARMAVPTALAARPTGTCRAHGWYSNSNWRPPQCRRSNCASPQRSRPISRGLLAGQSQLFVADRWACCRCLVAVLVSAAQISQTAPSR